MSVKCVPPQSHFYIAKLGYAGVYLFFLFLLQNIDCGYSLERRGGSNVYPPSMFSAKIYKISKISNVIFSFLQLKKIYIAWANFRNVQVSQQKFIFFYIICIFRKAY